MIGNIEIYETYVPCQLFGAYEYCTALHVVGNLMIEVNRFCCFRLPASYDRMWKGGSFKTITALVLLAPLAAGGYRVAQDCAYGFGYDFATVLIRGTDAQMVRRELIEHVARRGRVEVH